MNGLIETMYYLLIVLAGFAIVIVLGLVFLKAATGGKMTKKIDILKSELNAACENYNETFADYYGLQVVKYKTFPNTFFIVLEEYGKEGDVISTTKFRVSNI